eukprot:TRINITY_DN5453_c0_g1_i1.p1 TRINITY_DN5453_c0_g1~~TRINITY_DN5453_c0_g1_i1.p1  ORF type:complete len:1061 (+),score=251.87 TRINITY_DN5453_c0_g1_i1:40-3222(+)
MFHLVLALLFFTAVSSERISEEKCGLNCWLESLVVQIPDMKINKNGAEIDITNFTCFKFFIGAISSSLPTPTSIQGDIQNVHVDCTGNWALSWSIVSGSGGIVANATMNDLGIVLDLVKSENGLVNHSQVTSCNSKLSLDATFEGSGAVEKVAEWLFPYVKSYLISEIESLVCEEIKNVAGTNLTALLNDVNADLLPYMHGEIQPILPIISLDAISLQNNSVVTLLNYILNDVVGANGDLGINKIVNTLTENSDGAVFITPEKIQNFTKGYNISVPLDFQFPIGELAKITIIFEGLNITGLNTWQDVKFFVPVGEHVLSTLTNLSRLDINLTIGVKLSESTGPVSAKSLEEQVTFSLSMHNNTLKAGTLVALNHTFLGNLIPMQLIDPGCACSGIEYLQIPSAIFDLGLKKFEILAVSGDIEQQFDHFLSTILELFTSSFSETIPIFFNAIVAGPAREEVNSAITSLLSEQTFCGVLNPNKEPAITTELLIIFFSVVGILSIVVVLLLMAYQYGVFEARPKKKKDKKKDKKDKKKTEKDSLIQDGNVNTPYSINEIAEETSGNPTETVEYGYSLATDPKVPALARYGLPVLLFLNIGTFIVANVAVGASVEMRVILGEEEIWLPSLFDFTLANSVRDMWQAGVYPLSIIIGAFSGAWPYIKLLMAIWSWFAPPRFFSVKRRETVLMILDALGKWSLIDAYVMIVMLVSFRVSLTPPESPHSTLDVIVFPQLGFHFFLGSTISSLILSHVILAFHRLSVDPSFTKEEEEYLSAKGYTKNRVLCKKAFYGTCGDRCNVFGPFFMAGLLITTLCLTVVGSLTKAFEFDIGGLAGFVMAYIGGSPDTQYSVISLGLSIPASSVDPNAASIRFIQVAFFIFTFAIPLANTAVTLLLWLLPLPYKAQMALYKTTEVLNAWSGVDVFVVAIFVSLVELNQFATFVVGDRCDFLEAILKEYFSTALHGDTTCFLVTTYLSEGSWLLFISVVCYLISSTFVMRTSRAALRSRQEKFTKKIETWLACAANNKQDKAKDCEEMDHETSRDESDGGEKKVEEREEEKSDFYV